MTDNNCLECADMWANGGLCSGENECCDDGFMDATPLPPIPKQTNFQSIQRDPAALAAFLIMFAQAIMNPPYDCDKLQAAICDYLNKPAQEPSPTTALEAAPGGGLENEKVIHKHHCRNAQI